MTPLVCCYGDGLHLRVQHRPAPAGPTAERGTYAQRERGRERVSVSVEFVVA